MQSIFLILLFSSSCLTMTPQTAAHQASLSFTISQSLLKLNPEIEPMSSRAPTLASRFFTVSATWEAKYS